MSNRQVFVTMVGNIKICIFSKDFTFTKGPFHVNLTYRCHPGSRISKLIFFVDSTANSKKKSHKSFSLKRLLFGLEQFELYDFFWPKKVKFTKWPPKMSRYQILYSNETLLYVKFSKFSIFNSFEAIGIHLHSVF
jgi:hypothetical protein